VRYKPAAMLIALLRAFSALSAPPLRRIAAESLGFAVLTFGLLWLTVAAALYRAHPFAWRLLDWVVELLGGLAVLGLTWLLFPAVVTLIAGLFVNRIATAVEAMDYPVAAPPRNRPWGEMVAVMLRLTAATIALNLLALPLYLLVPGINLVLFLVMNGYLLGRGYFEVVALRRLDAAAARAVRSRFAGRIFLGGVVIAGLFALPLVNLLAPVIATAFMVHVFEALPRIEPQTATRFAG
jgi:CysZ protein